MARIIGGTGTSHVPTIGLAFDKGRQADPDWPLFEGYEPVAAWLAEKQPDVLFFCFMQRSAARRWTNSSGPAGSRQRAR